jgi:hypothetical protein
VAAEQIVLCIHLMESIGLRQHLEMRYLVPTASKWHGMEHYGSLEALRHMASQILASHILPMESTGLRRLLEIHSLRHA